MPGAEEEQRDDRPAPRRERAHRHERVHGGGAVAQVDERRPVEPAPPTSTTGVDSANATHCQPSNISAGIIEIATVGTVSTTATTAGGGEASAARHPRPSAARRARGTR